MAAKKWTLIDQSANTNIQDFALPPGKLPGAAAACSVAKHTLQGGLSEGVESIRIDNGALALEVLPTRGMGIWKAWSGEARLGWKSPVRGPVHPKFVPLAEPSGLGWLDGFDELFVRCGLESNGAPEFDDNGALEYPLHGRIANRPAHFVQLEADGDTGEISLTGAVTESRFLLRNLRLTTTIRTRVGEPGFSVCDEIENLSAVPAEAQLLYHINFGPPLLEQGARFVAPVQSVTPRDARAVEGLEDWTHYGPPEPGFAEQVYFLDLLADAEGRTSAMLQNRAGDFAVSLGIHRQELPCFTLWKNTGDLENGYVTGLEPAANFPNPRSFEGQQGRVIRLGPGEKHVCHLRMSVHTDTSAVEQAAAKIAELQGGTQPTINPKPLPDLCAG